MHYDVHKNVHKYVLLSKWEIKYVHKYEIFTFSIQYIRVNNPKSLYKINREAFFRTILLHKNTHMKSQSGNTVTTD